MTEMNLRWRILQAIVAAGAVVALFGLGHVLQPAHAQTTVASGRIVPKVDDDEAQQQMQADEQRAEDESVQAAEEQNEEAQAQANQDIYQAEQSDPQLIQNAQQSPAN